MARILHAVFSGEMAGGQRVCLDLIRDRLAAGDLVSLATPSRGPFTERCPEGVAIDVLPFRTLRDLIRLPRLVRYLRRLAPDLVHTHTAVPGNILWRLACKVAGVPLVNHMHIENYFGRRSFKARLVRFLDTLTSSFPACHIPVSEHTARSLEKQGYPKERLFVVHNGVSWPGLRVAPVDRAADVCSKPVIGCVGRLCESKGQADLLRAMPRILETFPDATIWLIGKDQHTGGQYELRLKRLAESLSVGEHVVFWGHRDDVLELMGRMGVLVLPSYDEGFPIVLLEAMSLGVPVVATRVAGIPELVDDGEMGYLIAPGDLAALAERIVRLLADPDSRFRLGERGRQHVSEHFTREAMLDKVRSIYAMILDQHHAACH
jgi:glycosyltransferase involved in cell wall biosynthesis